jgi:hypothetical protein
MASIETTGVSESIVGAIKSKTDKLTFDANNRLAIQNPPNLDVALSTRASEATLSAIKNALVSVGTDRIYTYLYGRYKSAVAVYSGTVTSSGSSSDANVSQFSVIELELKVTSVSGTTPTLDVYIEGKFENTGDYKVLASQTGITSTGTWFFTVNPCTFRYIRVRWVVGGTSPSFTFRVDAQAMA